MKIFSVLLILAYLQIIISFSVEDFVIEEVKRTMDLKGSVISIQNQIRLKKTTFEDTFRYLVPKNNSHSLIRITVEASKKKKLEISKISDDNDYDYYDIFLQGSTEITVKEDYFEKLLFKPKNIYVKENQLELFLDTINLVSAYPVKTTTTTVICFNRRNSTFHRKKIIYSL